MRIDAVKSFLVDSGSAKHWLFVKVETDEGIHGWGEAYTQLDRDRVIKRQMDELSRYLIGRDPVRYQAVCLFGILGLCGQARKFWSCFAPSAALNRRCGISRGRPRGSRSTTC